MPWHTMTVKPKRSRRITAALAALVVVVIVVAAVLFRRAHGLGQDVALTDNAAAPAPTARAVSVYTVRRRDLSRDLKLSGEFRPYQVARVYAKIAGFLKTISVDYGSRVSAGDVIATLEVPEQEAEVERTEAAYRFAKLEYDRVASVDHSEPGLIAQADVDKALATYEAARDQRDQARSMLAYSVITAPFDGIVTKRYVDPGTLIQQGANSNTQAEPIVQISDNYRLRLIVQAPESIVPEIKDGTPVDIRVQANGRLIRGRVARYSYDVHEDTRTMHTEIDVPNADLSLKPGMYAFVSIVLESRHEVPAVPVQAVSSGDEPSVLVVDENDVLREVPVTVGLETPNWVEIRRGVEPGDRVYIGDRNSVTVGTKVRPEASSVAVGP